METILDLPKYLDTYKNILLVNHSTKNIKDLLPNHTFSKLNIKGIDNVEQLDRQLKLELLLTNEKLFLIEHIHSINYFPFQKRDLSTTYTSDSLYYSCIFDNFKNIDAKLVNLSIGEPNKYLIKNSDFIAKINKNNSIVVIKNKYNYYISNWVE